MNYLKRVVMKRPRVIAVVLAGAGVLLMNPLIQAQAKDFQMELPVVIQWGPNGS